MNIRPGTILPAEIVFHPDWWHRHEGIIFDRDFFFHPRKRVEEELHMENALYERWGRHGLGGDHGRVLPVIGPVHLAAGFMTAGMMGCEIKFQPGSSPLTVGKEMDMHDFGVEEPFASRLFEDFRSLTEALHARFGYLTGDVDWNGILNNALDVFGQKIFLEMSDNPDQVKELFRKISIVEERFFRFVASLTGTTSTAVNRSVRHFPEPILLHSECSHTMISEEFYESFLLPFDMEWAGRYPPFGIHFCGGDLHRFTRSYGSIPGLSFIDAGWGSDLKMIRAAFPDVFLNIRLSPVEIVRGTREEIKSTITRLVHEAGGPLNTGICCINIDGSAGDEQIDEIFETVEEIRNRCDEERK